MANLSNDSREARRLALEAAVRTRNPDSDSPDDVAAAAGKYLKFLLGE